MTHKNYSLNINNIPLNIAVYKYDKDKDDFIFIDFNASAEKTEKISKRELLGKYLLDIFPSAKEFGIFDIFKKAYLSGEQQYHKAEFYKDSRISGWRENDVYAIGNECIMSIYKDVSLDKSLENKLHMLGTIVNNSFNEIYIFNTTDFKFTYINHQAQKNIGYTLHEMREMQPWDIKPLYSEESFKTFITNQEFSIVETLHQRKDGTQYMVEAKVQKMILNHEEHYVVMSSDITQKYVYEEKLILSKEVIDSIS
ncbi:MAG: PAS domain S-box protein [Sulfurimonas sp.]